MVSQQRDRRDSCASMRRDDLAIGSSDWLGSATGNLSKRPNPRRILDLRPFISILESSTPRTSQQGR